MNERFRQIITLLQQKKRIVASIVILVGVIVILTTIFLSRQAILPYGQYIVRNIDQLPNRDIALVFGGGIEKDGSQSIMQEHRIKTAVELYKKGKVKKIMITGDDGLVRFNEIDIMTYYARTHGVPVYDIMSDPHGYRTYESCYREQHVYGIQNAIAISQEFHLPRILYFCRNFGIDIIGFPADYQGYQIDPRMLLRETLARVKGWWQMTVSHPFPRIRS